MLTFTDSDGTTTTHTLDVSGNPTSSTTSGSGGSRTVQRTYTTTPAVGNGANRVPAGQVASYTDPTGLVTTYTYGTDGRSVTTNTDGKQDSYQYDTRWNLTSHVDALSNTTSWSYDALDRLLSTVLPSVGGSSDSYTFSYTASRPYFLDRSGRTQP